MLNRLKALIYLLVLTVFIGILVKEFGLSRIRTTKSTMNLSINDDSIVSSEKESNPRLFQPNSRISGQSTLSTVQSSNQQVSSYLSPLISNNVLQSNPTPTNTHSTTADDIRKETAERFDYTILGNLDLLDKREFIRNMTRTAIKGYFDYASGCDELDPISKKCHNWYTEYSCLSTPIDSLTTLWIMGLHDEFSRAKKLVFDHFEIIIDAQISFFETGIRILGGLLGAFELDGDFKILEKAIHTADVLFRAFNTSSGLPYSSINPSRPDQSFEDSIANIAELGSIQLEMQYLSDITGNKTYEIKALRVYDILETEARREYNSTDFDGLYPFYYSTSSGKPLVPSTFSVSGCTDSLYEYLLKIAHVTDDKKQVKSAVSSWESIKRNLLVEKGNQAYVTQVTEDSSHKVISKLEQFDHLVSCSYQMFDSKSCFTGGMFALLSTKYSLNPERDLQVAERIVNGCYAGYQSSPTGLSGETILDNNGTFIADESEYKLRPELVESIFYMWRITKKPIYREMAWNITISLQRYTFVGTGYSGLKNARDPSSLNDKQPSFFIAETLKYLFLTFADDDVINLDKYVFNTEAHPLSIRGHGRRALVKRQ